MVRKLSACRLSCRSSSACGYAFALLILASFAGNSSRFSIMGYWGCSTLLSAAGASDMSSFLGICVEWLARGQLHRTLISLLLIAECLTSATSPGQSDTGTNTMHATLAMHFRATQELHSRLAWHTAAELDRCIWTQLVAETAPVHRGTPWSCLCPTTWPLIWGREAPFPGSWCRPPLLFTWQA